MTGMDILEFRDKNQPPPVCKIIGDEETHLRGEDSSPPWPELFPVAWTMAYTSQLRLSTMKDVSSIGEDKCGENGGRRV